MSYNKCKHFGLNDTECVALEYIKRRKVRKILVESDSDSDDEVSYCDVVLLSVISNDTRKIYSVCDRFKLDEFAAKLDEESEFNCFYRMSRNAYMKLRGLLSLDFVLD